LLKFQKIFKAAYTKIDKNSELTFLKKSIQGKIEIPKESMSGDALSRRINELAFDKNVLEFGAGGSTFLFAAKCNTLISIESDFFYARKISRLLQSFGNTRVIWANIGPTK
jgi:hypothetical protein